MQVPNPEQTASYASSFFYLHLTPLIWFTHTTPRIQSDDLPPLCDYDHTAYLKKKSFPVRRTNIIWNSIFWLPIVGDWHLLRSEEEILALGFVKDTCTGICHHDFGGNNGNYFRLCLPSQYQSHFEVGGMVSLVLSILTQILVISKLRIMILSCGPGFGFSSCLSHRPLPPSPTSGIIL